MNRTRCAIYLLQAALILNLMSACTGTPTPGTTESQDSVTQSTATPSVTAPPSSLGLVHSPAPPLTEISSDTLLVLAVDDSLSMRSCPLQEWRYAIAKLLLRLAEQYGEMS